ncbi:MAG: S-layer homology domain-containing protein, partial [Chloroflexia bacterium]
KTRLAIAVAEASVNEFQSGVHFVALASLPTQTSGGPTATTEPTHTSTSVPTSTNTPTNTAVSTSTEVPSSTPTNLPGGTATPTACTIQFTDVPPANTFYANIRCLACRGIINGYACGGAGEPCNGNNDPYFRPGNQVTRGQIAKIASNSAGFSEPVSGQTFEDVARGSTFYDFVERLVARNVMNGYACGGTGEPCVPPFNRPYFRPNSTATRGQLAKITSNAANFTEPVSGQTFEDVVIGSTFYDYVERLASRGAMNGYACGGGGEPCVSPGNLPYFRPNSNVTRGQTSKIVGNAFFPGCNPPRLPLLRK